MFGTAQLPKFDDDQFLQVSGDTGSCEPAHLSDEEIARDSIRR